MKLFTPKQLKHVEDANLDALRGKQFEVSKILNEKLRLLSNIDAEYVAKKQEKEKELAEIEAKRRITVFNLTKDVENLEERRRQALTPIVEEQKQLFAKQNEVSIAMQRLETERLALTGEQQVLREKKSEFALWKARAEQLQDELMQELHAQKSESDKLLAEARAISQRIMQERDTHDERMRKLEEKGRNIENAERLVKVAMIAADKRIAQEQEEHRKVVEQRKSLAAAIKEAKKRGIWQKTQ